MNINELNKHERDHLIEFDPVPHKYTCAGEADYMSVTTWLHSHFKQFDADAIIKKMMSNPVRWKKSPYYGQTAEQIKAQWDKGRDEAAAAGTAMHADIERWALHPEEENSALSPHFLAFLKDHPDLKPYRAEWMIFHEEIRLAGSIDLVVGGLRPPDPPLRASPSPEPPHGSKEADALEGVEGGLLSPLGVQGVTSVTLFDWKRCKEIKKTNSFGEFALTECIDHLPDTNYWHYALQLNTYKAILEAKYGKKVEKMVLVCLHPNLPSYQLLTVPDLSGEIAALFALRQRELELAK